MKTLRNVLLALLGIAVVLGVCYLLFLWYFVTHFRVF